MEHPDCPVLASTHSQGMLYTPLIMPKLSFLVEEK